MVNQAGLVKNTFKGMFVFHLSKPAKNTRKIAKVRFTKS
ncbi:conserved hypothetical protein [Alteromonas macleodii]|jgi:hypothetical protein|uniref:Uncharacterized protein n=1 Tax=Alteromonas macleodii TaxID=28108 RepID=A0AB36FR94_ALTMA|nr:hypothetical protein BFV95_3771 [Alteromonas macleodii]OES27512.1 hypothetical protein BFV94_3766 [Alteromonas macleodii]OES27758.1 hypothetical protein BFV93_3761 [Alteromonas macleodii]OES39789.1 hypothetical protein BFV96_3755 [Alteromonas macleodii]CAI3968233.1 hypothetical protein MIT1002_03686 [Alteromonas macleodii]